MTSLMEYVKHFEGEMRCNCDLDNWEPEQSTGHSHVCRIHKAAENAKRYSRPLPVVLDESAEPSA
jgi:hypothetical protein